MMRHEDFLQLRIALERMVEAPPFDAIERRARRVRWRRAVLAVVTVSAVVVVAVVLADAAVRITRPLPSPPPAPGPPFAVRQVSFVDARTGYVLVRGCADGSRCAAGWSLGRTVDGGRTWRRLESPVPADDAETVSLTARGQRDVSVADGAARYLSHDAGQTWRRVAIFTAGPVVDTVPAGFDLAPYCPDDRGTGCVPRLAAYDEVNGVRRPLRRQPQLHGDVTGIAVGGTQVWLVTARAAADTPRLARSDDGGRTWREVPAPAFRDWFLPEITLAAGGGPAYLVNRSRQQFRLTRVWRLTGESAQPWTPAAMSGLPETVNEVRVLSNGELRYSDVVGNAWQTEDRATRVVPAPKATVDGVEINVNVVQEVDGVLVATPVIGRRGDRILFSTDAGRQWTVRPIDF